MICARFHSVILSSLFRQKIFVMSYSSKIDCVIDDLELNLPILQLKDIKEDLKIKPENFKTVDEQKMIRIIEQSKEQHKVLEKVLKDVK